MRTDVCRSPPEKVPAMLVSFCRPVRIVLGALLTLWTVALVGSLALELTNAPVAHSTVTWLFRSTSPLLVLIGWVLYAGGPRDGLGPIRLMVALGMSVSCLGDVVMGQIIPTPEPILTGIAVFGTAHIIYIIAFAIVAGRLGLTSARVRWASMGMAVAVGVACWSIFVRNPAAAAALNIGALVYALIIGSMGGMALALALGDRRFIQTAVGAGLFMLSDVMLGAWALRDTRWEYIGEAVWWSYIIGQMLIVWSIGTLRKVAPDPDSSALAGNLS
ncbi:MAG TPA: hypothetical protein DGT21_05085 [Armatimonadetes bacterium]|jgi:hypothetical protein|nr:hypothetical protein [Armatimonadota bacterium]